MCYGNEDPGLPGPFGKRLPMLCQSKRGPMARYRTVERLWRLLMPRASGHSAQASPATDIGSGRRQSVKQSHAGLGIAGNLEHKTVDRAKIPTPRTCLLAAQVDRVATGVVHNVDAKLFEASTGGPRGLRTERAATDLLIVRAHRAQGSGRHVSDSFSIHAHAPLKARRASATEERIAWLSWRRLHEFDAVMPTSTDASWQIRRLGVAAGLVVAASDGQPRSKKEGSYEDARQASKNNLPEPEVIVRLDPSADSAVRVLLAAPS